MVAAASLAITAWGTYKAAQVADDQLAQSREDNEKDERAQASRISIWVEGERPTRVVLGNRSLDPAWAYVYVATADDLAATGSRKGRLLGIGVLPPCTRLNVPLAKLSEDSQKAFRTKKQGPYGLVGLAFRDAEARTWVRLASGALRPLDKLEAAQEGALTWATDKGVEIKTLSECGRAG